MDQMRAPENAIIICRFTNYAFYPIRSEALVEMKKVIKRYKSMNPPGDATLAQAEEVFETFREFQPRLGLKTGERALWFRQSLISLPGITTKFVLVTIPNEMLKIVNSLITQWAEEAQSELRKRQQL